MMTYTITSDKILIPFYSSDMCIVNEIPDSDQLVLLF
jgi:hypothetical protein